jgi:hypothetical protein
MGPFEREIRSNPATHNFVHLILDEADKRDIVDAANDCIIAMNCLRERVEEAFVGLIIDLLRRSI